MVFVGPSASPDDGLVLEFLAEQVAPHGADDTVLVARPRHVVCQRAALFPELERQHPVLVPTRRGDRLDVALVKDAQQPHLGRDLGLERVVVAVAHDLLQRHPAVPAHQHHVGHVELDAANVGVLQRRSHLRPAACWF